MNSSWRFQRRALSRHLRSVLTCESLEARRVLAAVPVISEFQASNSSTLNDGDGNSSDWIELFNPSDSPIDLTGWHLTDDASQLSKWRFPAAPVVPAAVLTLDPAEHLVVFASGQDGDSYVDEAGNLHTNFKLGADGEFLGLVRPDGQTVEHAYAPTFPPQEQDASYGLSFDVSTSTLIPEGAMARYTVPTGPISNWQQLDFNDNNWQEGPTGIGYENSPADYFGLIETTVPRGTTTAYLRQTFDVNDATAIDSLVLGVRYDDGFIAYLNGQEIVRENAPGIPQWSSSATSGHPDTSASIFIRYDVSAFTDELQNGTNVLAIHALNTSGSSDMLIETTLDATNGILKQPLEPGILRLPTPGTTNGAAFQGFVSDTLISVDRGFFEGPFTVSLNSATPGAMIVYTTDGSEPSPTNGTRIESADESSPPQGTAQITTTTVLRAATFKESFVPGTITTRSYMFAADIANSSVLDRGITQDARYAPLIEEALLDIPSISLAFDNPIDNSTSEQATSIEWLTDDGDPGFQIDAGIRAFGGEFTNFAKKNFRLYFRSEYGASKLEFPLFEGFERGIPAAQVFDQLNLRTGSHDMAMRGFYMSNRFTDDTMLDMGNVAPHGRFVHVYLNGTYWGQYHLRERWNADMVSQYNGGNDQDYESINGNRNVGGWSPGEAYDGDGSAWNAIKGMRQDYEAIREHLDVQNYIDYMLLYMSGNSENEYRTSGTPDGTSPFQFFLNDADGWLRSVSDRTNNPGPGNILSGLLSEGHPDFEILLADRIQEMFYNDGVLTPERSVARLQERMDEIEKSFIVESARWGYRTPTSWQNAANNAINSILPNIAPTMISRLRSRGFIPDLDAPTFSQHGGAVPNGFQLQLASGGETGQLDGNLASGKPAIQSSDGFNRTADLAVNGNLSDFSHTDTGDLMPYFEVDLSGVASLENIVIHNRGNCCQHRLYNISVEIRDADNNVVYTSDTINPVEEGGTPTSPGSSIEVNLPEGTVGRYVRVNKTPVNGANSTEWLTIAELEANGEYLVAPQGPGIYYTLDGSDPRLPGGDVDPNAQQYLSPITVSSGMIVKTRNFDGQTWSALNQAEFDVPKANASNLRVSEIQYNPHPALPSFGELDVDTDDFEFVELQNVGNQPIDLQDVRFMEAPNEGELQGIQFRFAQQQLAPGGSVVIAKNQDAFASRYGTGVNVAGEFNGKLANGGEQLSLFAADGSVIQQFEYNDSGKWPARADGVGSSLVILDFEGDYDAASNWTASVAIGGTPGTPSMAGDAVVINEVHANSPDSNDAIEFYNASAQNVDMSGWLLSDSAENWFKHEIAANTVLPPNNYLVLDESHFNSSNGISPQDFALSSSGDDIWLIATAPQGKPLRFVDHVDFQGTLPHTTLGRIPNGSTDNQLFPLEASSFGQKNEQHLAGDVIISEIQYNPDGTTLPALAESDLEFIELYNRSDRSITLSGETGWRIRGGVDFDFQAHGIVTLAPGDVVTVVHFDPIEKPETLESFQAFYGLPDDAKLVGPFEGKLDNQGESVKLLAPTGQTHYLVDRVTYDDVAPWPLGANGTGGSLTRRSSESFGDAPANWVDNTPSPAIARFATDVLMADLDRDGEVGFSDFLQLSANFGKENAVFEDGDIDGDGTVSFADFLFLSNEFGRRV